MRPRAFAEATGTRSGANVNTNCQLPLSPVRSTTGRPTYPTSMNANCGIPNPSNAISPKPPTMPHCTGPLAGGGPGCGASPRRTASAIVLQSFADGLSAGPGAPGVFITSA